MAQQTVTNSIGLDQQLQQQSLPPEALQGLQQQQQGLAVPKPWDLARPARVLSLEGLNPLVLGGQWLPDVKLAAGCVDASGQKPGDGPQRITLQQVGCQGQ